MKKIIIFNILMLILGFFIIDYAVFAVLKHKYNASQAFYFKNMFKKIATSEKRDKDYLNNELDEWRHPLNSKVNEKSIIFTGCSFMYGDGLKEEDTLPYLISKKINNPVYNLAMCSKAINTTLAMLRNGLFFEKSNNSYPAVFIYLYCEFHLKRIVMPNEMFESNEFLYKIKNNTLIRKKPPFIVSRFPLLSFARENIFEFNLHHNRFYKEYLKKLLKLHFIEVKNLIDKKYPNVKFIILVFSDSDIFEQIANDLEKEGFIIIRIKEDFGYDLDKEQYNLPDGHPNANAWLGVAPMLIEKLKIISDDIILKK